MQRQSYTGLEKRKIHYWVYMSMESAKMLPVENSTFLNTFKNLCEVIINFTQVLFKGRQALSVKSYSLLKHYTYLCSWNKFPGFRAQSPCLEVSSINIWAMQDRCFSSVRETNAGWELKTLFSQVNNYFVLQENGTPLKEGFLA